MQSSLRSMPEQNQLRQILLVASCIQCDTEVVRTQQRCRSTRCPAKAIRVIKSSENVVLQSGGLTCERRFVWHVIAAMERKKGLRHGIATRGKDKRSFQQTQEFVHRPREDEDKGTPCVQLLTLGCGPESLGKAYPERLESRLLPSNSQATSYSEHL